MSNALMKDWKARAIAAEAIMLEQAQELEALREVETDTYAQSNGWANAGCAYARHVSGACIAYLTDGDAHTPDTLEAENCTIGLYDHHGEFLATLRTGTAKDLIEWGGHLDF